MAHTQPRKPTHDICFVEERGRDQKGYWTTIGAAWGHKDNGGLNLQLDFVPVNLGKGRIVVRVRTDKPATGEAGR